MSVPTGTTKSLSATGKTTLSYTSSNTAVATVDSKGNVKGIKAGTAIITIKAKSTTKYNSLTKKVTVTVYDRADNSITCPDNLSIPWGTYKDLNATGKTTLSYSSSDISVATVDSNGNVTGIAPGSTTIIISAQETDEYRYLAKEVPVIVTEPESSTPTPLPTEIGGPTVPEVPQEVYEVSRIAYDDCDGSGHGYYEITYSDGTVVYEEY